MKNVLRVSLPVLFSVLAFGAAAPVASAMTQVISGNTASGENQPGWLFNRDPSTQSPYQFNLDQAKIGIGSLFVPAITNTLNGNNDKFIAEDFLLTPIADITSISYDFRIHSSRTVADKNQFYMGVYANFGESIPTNYYDCRYSVVPTIGATDAFTTVTFDPTQTYPVATRSSSPHTCPASPSGMDALSTGSSTIRAIALNVGDTSSNDTGVSGYFDNVVINTNSGVTVNDFDPDTAKLVSNNEGEYFMTIQAAIDGTNVGGTINIPAGTYVEQITINKDLTLRGAGDTTVIQSPNTLSTSFTTSEANKAIVLVTNATTTISHLKVDGVGKGNANYRFMGIAYHNAGGVIDSTTVTGVRETPFNGNQHGNAIYAYNQDGSPRTITITNNTVSDYQKNGITTNGSGLTATISNNTITGQAVTSLNAQNGIQIGYGATGAITSNTISNNYWTGTGSGTNDPATDPKADGAAGILLYEPGTSSIEIANNILTGNQFGVWSVGATDVNIHGNNITGLAHTGNAFPVGITLWDTDQWGATEATTTGTIANNSISSNQYGILLRDQNPGGPTPDVSVTGNAISNSTTDGLFSDVSSNAARNWWGNPTGPTIASNVGGLGDVISTSTVSYAPWYIDAERTVLNTDAPVISPNGSVFHGSQDVTINVVTGTEVHYTLDGTTPTCSSTLYTGTLTFSNSVELKAIRCVVTTPVSAVASAIFSPAAGGNGGSSGGGGAISATPATPAVPTVSPAIPATPATPVARGRVLGAEAYNFTKDLRMGSTGADVTELQKLLIADGFDIPAITKGGMAYGTFGGQTLSAVIAYQKAHGISPARGYVSTLTRAELNKGTAGAAPVATGKTNLTASQANSIISLLQSFGADASVIAKVKASLGQ